MPFPYITAEKFERELPYSHENTDLSETEWDQLIEDKLKQESERVEGYSGQKWREAPEGDVPRLIEGAVIRLTRSVINQIEEDGLSSEKIDDHTEQYRPPSAIRAEVRAELADAGYEPTTDSGLTRNTDRTITITGDPDSV